MARAYGSNALLLLKRESVYGLQAAGQYWKMPFTSCALGSEQGLIDDPVLGQGRDPLQPLLDVINDEGDIVVPVDLRYLGFWLTGLLGNPVTTPLAATGSISFSGNPSAGETLTINGVIFTFTDVAPAGNEIEIQGTIIQTIDAVITVLNASADTNVDDATYARAPGTQVLSITHDTPGPAGNSFTLVKNCAVASVSGQTLTGGGYAHSFKSGSYTLPSYTLEVGMPEVPAYFSHAGCVINSLALSFERSGAAQATLNVIAQGEVRSDTRQSEIPTELSFNRISQFQGAIKQGGLSVANLTAAALSYSNGVEKIETIRPDGKIDGADPTIASLSGNITLRYSDNTLIDKAVAGVPVDLEFSYILSPHAKLVMSAHEVYINKPKLAIEGPGGIQQDFEFRGAKNAATGCMLTVVLVNDCDETVYA